MTFKIPKNKEFWVVELFGKKTIIQYIGAYVFECGDEEGWSVNRSDIGLKYIRKIKL